MLRKYIYILAAVLFFGAFDVINAQIDGPVLTLPANNQVNVTLNTTFTWDPVPNADNYIINIATDSLFTTVVTTRTVDTTFFNSSGLQNNVVYYWRVQAKILNVFSDYSSTFTFQTKLVTPAPSSPANGAAAVQTTVSISWSAVPGAASYILDVSTKSDFSDSVTTFTPAVTNRSVAGLLYNRIFYWRVKALQPNTNSSDYSPTRSFTTIKAGPGLTSPGNNFPGLTFTKVTYTWASLAGTETYELQVCRSNTFASEVKTYSSPVNTYTPSSDYLEYNTTYYWRVRARTGSIYTDYSPVYNFTTGTPGSEINTADAKIGFIHSEGRISDITFKQGSSRQLLETELNTRNKTGLFRISGEVGTRLTSWIENPGNYTYSYDNSTYGSKTLNIKYNADSIVVKLTLNLNANKSAVLNAALRPGGDADPLYDSVMYSTPSGNFYKFKENYTGVVTTQYSGSTVLSAMYDYRYPNEYSGFMVPDSISTSIMQAVSFGPIFTIPASASPQAKTISFGVMTKQGFFNWTNKKYINILTPAAIEKITDQDTIDVKWESFGVAGNVNIDLSVNGGAAFPYALVVNTANDGHYSAILPNLSAGVPYNNCKIRISGVGATGYSDAFSIVSGSSCVFSLPSILTGAPGERIYVPVMINPSSSDSVTAFDVRLEYNKELLSYIGSAVDPELTAKSWVTDAANSAANGYVQIGGFKFQGGFAITSPDTLLVLTFSIKSNARVGLQIPIRINNAYLSAGNDSARSIDAIGIDGKITIYTRVMGNLWYYISRRPVYADSLLTLYTYNTSGVLTDSVITGTNSSGLFDFTNLKPGSRTTLVPKTDIAYPNPRTAAIDAVDARKAFDAREGVSSNLNDLQKLSADINLDGVVSSIDALGILKISTGELDAADFGVTNWAFVDSSFVLGTASWVTLPGQITYNPLDTLKSKQTFWGIVRGDVDGDAFATPYFGAARLTEDMYMADPTVVYSIPQQLTAKPGDTLYLPLNVKLNGKSIGAFNASISLDRNKLTYSGRYKEGNVIPASKGWVISSYFDNTGTLNIGGTDFSSSVDVIKTDGTLAYFEFVVNDNALYGDTIQAEFKYLSTADGSLNNVTASGTNGAILVTEQTSSVEEEVPEVYSIGQNYPNPFNPVTTINYTLPKESKVHIEIFNTVGERIAVLVDQAQNTGRYSVRWDASSCASGVYLYRITAGSFMQSHKMILMK